MNDRTKSLPTPDRADAVVTYSRIGSRIVDGPDRDVAGRSDERISPTFEAIEVPPVEAPRRAAPGDLGGQTMADRPAAYGGGGRSLRFVMFAGVAAIALGIGVLALAYNSARTTPSAATAGDSAPAEVAAVPDEAPLDLTPAAQTSGEEEAEQALGTSAVPAGATEDKTPADVATVTTSAPLPEAAEASREATEAPSPAPAATPPIPRSRPKVDETIAAKPAAPVAEVADDDTFVSSVEKTLAEKPRPQMPANAGTAAGAGAEEPLPLPSPEIAGAYPAAEPTVAAPQRLVPPAEIPNAGTYDEAYGEPLAGESYDMPADGATHGQSSEAVYGEGDWDSDSEIAVAPAPQWIVLGVRGGRAIVDGREFGVFMVGPGSEIPGIGIVKAIEWRGGGWVVITSNGTVVSSLADSGRRY